MTSQSFQLKSLNSEQLAQVSGYEVTEIKELYNESNVCNICKHPQNTCLGHNKYIKLDKFIPKPLFIPQLERFLYSLDENFELSTVKNKNIEILYFDKINPKIFVSVVCNYEYLYKLIGFIFTGTVFHPKEKFIEEQCRELNITPDTKLCLNNGVVQKFIQRWCWKYSPNNEALQNIFIDVIPVPSITYRVQQQQSTNTYNSIYSKIFTYTKSIDRLKFQDITFRWCEQADIKTKDVKAKDVNEKPEKENHAKGTLVKNVFVLRSLFLDIDSSSKKRNKQLQTVHAQGNIQEMKLIYGLKRTSTAQLDPKINQYLQFITACYISMSKDTSKNAIVEYKNKMLELLKCQQNTQDPFSIFAACVNKEGYFRQAINSCRVNKSSRTVCTGNPLIHAWQCVCPQYIAENIYIPVKVNAQNYRHVVDLIKNYPNYPHVCQVRTFQKDYLINVTKDSYLKCANNLKLGDIVYRQIITNDICMTNRYPSIREESFGAHIVIVDPNIKSLQFSLQVVKKMNADFDGDELQLYFFSQQTDYTEIAMLSSTLRQLITYETGNSLIGGCPELKFMIYNFKSANNTTNLNNIVQRHFGNLTFNTNNVKIENGLIKTFDAKIASADSQFIASLAHYFSEAKVMTFIDELICSGYNLNKICGQTLYSKLFTEIPNKKDYQQKLITSLQNNIWDEIEYRKCLNNNMLEQIETISRYLKFNDGRYYDKLVDEFIDQLRAGQLQLGQMFDEQGEMIVSKYRSLPVFRKFERTPQAQGFVTNSYIQGLDSVDLFYETIPGRYQLFKKGTVIARDGYNTRCISKGMENVYMSYNNIVKGDGDSIVSLNYLYNPRNYFKKDVPLKDVLQRLQSVSKITNAKNTALVEKCIRQINLLYRRKDLVRDNDLKNCTQNQNQNQNCCNQIISFILPFDVQIQTTTIQDLKKLFVCRLTDHMTEFFMEIIQQQVFYLFVYCVYKFNILPDENANDETKQEADKMVKLYLESLCAPGEMIGLKAAMASTEPYSQDSLNAIHKKGTKQKIEIKQSTGGDRFSELVIGKKGPIVIRFKLLPGYDSQKFIQQYQQINSEKLNITYTIYQQYGRYFADILISLDDLAAYDVLFENIIQELRIQKFDIINLGTQGQYVKITISGTLPQIQKLKYKGFVIGHNYLYNIIEQEDPITKEKFIYANMNEKREKQAYQIYMMKEIDPDTIDINNPKFIYDISGILATKQIIYQQLHRNLSTLEATQSVQPSHVKLISDIMTKDGEYQIFSRTNYKKQLYKDVISLSLFEQGDMFLVNSIQNPRRYQSNTPLLSSLFGGGCNCGVNISEIEIL